MVFKERLENLKLQADGFINSYLMDLESHMAKPGLVDLYKSMKYSLADGGHRIRPALAMLTAEALGQDPKKVLPLGTAVEFIHTYSLVHDDLPCMDDDDERRGKPSNHKVFGDALAVLAGDALNTEAFFLLTKNYSSQPQLAVDLVTDLALSAGMHGMVGGQAADITLKTKQNTSEEIEFLHSYKTGALFKMSVMGAARICGANTIELKSLSDYARCFGLIFQITDDITDGHEDDGPSFVKAVGLEKAHETCLQLARKACQSLEIFGNRAQGLKDLVTYLGERTS
jgi:geranylgeranyl diphosphate synthase type II